jgi:hypothetical protein
VIGSLWTWLLPAFVRRSLTRKNIGALELTSFVFAALVTRCLLCRVSSSIEGKDMVLLSESCVKCTAMVNRKMKFLKIWVDDVAGNF